jgi:predicted AlkP superfamily phosphohydrolase/phosphomutase
LLEKEVNINFILRENGFLNLKPDSKRSYADIDFDTKAFALEPARIYINLENKYPRGSVKENEYDLLIEELISIFNDLELNGRKVIKKIFRKEEIYKGQYTNQAPDIVLIPNKGFNLKTSIKANNLYEKSIFTGKHTQHDAFLLIANYCEKNIISDRLNVSDVCDIIDKLESQS